MEPLLPSRVPGPVALVAPRYPPDIGGIERHVAELARGLTDRGIAVEVVTCDPTRRLPTRSVEGGVIVHRFPTLADDGVFFVSPALGLWLLGNATRFGLVHAHGYHTPLALQALVAARRAGRPFVLTPHYHGTGHSAVRRLLHVPYRLIGRRVVRASRPLICVSRAERALLQRRFGKDLQAVIVPNGVEVDEIRRASPFEREAPGRLVVCAGRLEPYKNVDRVIAAMTLLPREDRLVILGGGPAAPALQAFARASGLGERVRFAGSVPTADLQRWLRTADVAVSLSSHEAFGIGLLEAGVAGAGVVASGIPTHREVASYLPPGRVVFVGPDCGPSGVAAAVRAIGREALDDAAVARVPRWSDTVDGTLDAYARLLGRVCSRPGVEPGRAPAGP